MSRAYDEYRHAEHLVCQVTSVFGRYTPEFDDAVSVQNYWYDRWVEEGYPVQSPPDEILHDRITEALRGVKRDRKMRGVKP